MNQNLPDALQGLAALLAATSVATLAAGMSAIRRRGTRRGGSLATGRRARGGQ